MKKHIIHLEEKETTIEVRLVKDVGRCVKGIFKQNNLPFKSGKFWGYVFCFKANYIYVILHDVAIRHNYVAHEIDHVREFIREYNGLTGLEDLACMVGYISNEIFKFLSEHNVEVYYDFRKSDFKLHKIKERFAN